MPWIVIDRGGDATVILDELVRGRSRFTVRASWDRRVGEGQPRTFLRETLAKQAIQQHYDVQVPAGHKRVARRARMTVQVASVELNVSHDWQALRSNPTVNVVWAREVHPPPGEKPLDWMLYTNAPLPRSKTWRSSSAATRCAGASKTFTRPGSPVTAGSRRPSFNQSPP